MSAQTQIRQTGATASTPPNEGGHTLGHSGSGHDRPERDLTEYLSVGHQHRECPEGAALQLVRLDGAGGIDRAPAGTSAVRVAGGIPAGATGVSAARRFSLVEPSRMDRAERRAELHRKRSHARALRRRQGSLLDREAGMATAEYAIATLAAVAFAGLLVAVLSSGEIRGLLMSLITSALNFG